MGQGQAQPARPCADHVDQPRQGAEAARCQGHRHRRGFSADRVGGSVCRRRTDELPRPVAQLHGAGAGALRRPCGGRGCRHLGRDRRRSVRADRDRLPRIAARHRRRRRDEARCAPAARRPLHPGGGPEADASLEHRQEDRLYQGRHRGRVPRRRRHHRATLYEPAGASGLYRAACLRRVGRGRQPDDDLELEPGPVHGARLLRQAPRSRHRRHPRDPGRNRRRVRRQDAGLLGAGGLGAGQEDRPPDQDGDEPRGGVPRHRAGCGLGRRGQARRQKGRQADRRRGQSQIPGRRLSGVARRARLHVRVCDVRPAQCPGDRLRCGLEPAQGRGLPRAGRAEFVLGCRKLPRRAGAAAGDRPAGLAPKKRSQGRGQGGARADLAKHRLCRDRRCGAEPPAYEGKARPQPGPRHRLGLLVQHRRRVRARPATSTRTAPRWSRSAPRTSAARAPRWR